MISTLAGAWRAGCAPGDARVGEERDARSARTFDPLETAFESELGAWLAWLQAARDARVDHQVMRRLEVVYGVGWTAVTVAGLGIAPLGVTAAMLTVVFLIGMLVLGYVVTAPRPGRLDSSIGAVAPCPEWSSLSAAERAHLIRVMNLSRVAERPSAARLLLSELDEALAAEPLASWPPLRDLRNIVGAGWSGLIPFGSEALPSGWSPIE